MTTPRGRNVPVLLAAAVLIGGANIAAYAANGRPILLGSNNAETRTTVVRNSGPGPALSLQSRASVPSLAVSSPKKVIKLNADRVDGLGARTLQTRPLRFTIPASTGTSSLREVTFPGLPPGRYQASYSIVVQASSPVRCYLKWEPAKGLSISPLDGAIGTNVATALVDTRTEALTLSCWSSAAFKFLSDPYDSVSEVILTRVDNVTDKVAVATRPAPGRGSGLSGATGR